MEQSTSQVTETYRHNVVAVFVIHFDIHKGNIIEWQYPDDVDLKGIEYQAICSGLHKIKTDTIYFSREKLYGISAFQNKLTNVERGAYMKAIGVLVVPTRNTGLCGQVWQHQEFLEKELIKHMDATAEVDPKRYDCLIEHYDKHKYDESPIHEITLPSVNSINCNTQYSLNYNLKCRSYYNQKILNDDNFNLDLIDNFLNYYGPDIFILWKAALLRKRVMLVNDLPVENACKYGNNQENWHDCVIHITEVYYIYLLGQVPEKFRTHDLIPKFAVGVNDIPELQVKNEGYIACTTDSIFEFKPNLYDILVLNKPHQPCFKSNSIPCKRNSADAIRYQTLHPTNERDGFSLSSIITRIYYHLYDDHVIKNDIKSTWQNLFAGSSYRRLNSTHSLEHDLLSLNETEDAREIDNGQVFEAVVSKASMDSTLQSERSKNIIRIFQYMTSFLLEKLQDIISLNEENGLNLIPIYPEDMVKLSLDPQSDSCFVTELAGIYFKKRVRVYGFESMCYIKDCTSCCQERISI